MNILIIDDDKGFRSMLFTHLHHYDHDVSVLCNGHNALSLLADPKHGFDLVFVDLKMPRVDGAAVVRALGDWKSVPVKFVFVSGLIESAKLAQLPNVVGVLSKPFSLGQINEIVSKVAQDIKDKAAHL